MQPINFLIINIFSLSSAGWIKDLNVGLEVCQCLLLALTPGWDQTSVTLWQLAGARVRIVSDLKAT